MGRREDDMMMMVICIRLWPLHLSLVGCGDDYMKAAWLNPFNKKLSPFPPPRNFSPIDARRIESIAITRYRLVRLHTHTGTRLY
jgi:hypothetical protein